MKILNFGSLNLDYVYYVEHFVQPGETLAAKQQKIPDSVLGYLVFRKRINNRRLGFFLAGSDINRTLSGRSFFVV